MMTLQKPTCLMTKLGLEVDDGGVLVVVVVDLVVVVALVVVALVVVVLVVVVALVVVVFVVVIFSIVLASTLSSTSSKLAAMNGFSSSLVLTSDVGLSTTLIFRVALPTTSETSNDALTRRTLVVTCRSRF
jgi:hypothetical protein